MSSRILLFLLLVQCWRRNRFQFHLSFATAAAALLFTSNVNASSLHIILCAEFMRFHIFFDYVSCTCSMRWFTAARTLLVYLMHSRTTRTTTMTSIKAKMAKKKQKCKLLNESLPCDALVVCAKSQIFTSRAHVLRSTHRLFLVFFGHLENDQ